MWEKPYTVHHIVSTGPETNNTWLERTDIWSVKTLWTTVWFFHNYIYYYNLASSLGDLRNSENEPHPSPAASSVGYQGTPSHLSIGTSSLYTTTGWTEGTPSYTESSMSGSLGRYSADPGQFSNTKLLLGPRCLARGQKACSVKLWVCCSLQY